MSSLGILGLQIEIATLRWWLRMKILCVLKHTATLPMMEEYQWPIYAQGQSFNSRFPSQWKHDYCFINQWISTTTEEREWASLSKIFPSRVVNTKKHVPSMIPYVIVWHIDCPFLLPVFVCVYLSASSFIVLCNAPWDSRGLLLPGHHLCCVL